MATVQQTIIWTPKILTVTMDASGLTWDVQYTTPGQPPGPPRRFTISAADKCVRDPLGAVMYPDYSMLALGLLAAASGCWAQVNTIFAQAIADGKVVPT